MTANVLISASHNVLQENVTVSGSRNSGIAVTQKDMRRGIAVGPTMEQVSPVAYWYKNGHFKNEDEARGAFRLAYQQGLDGMDTSIQEWMGLTEEEFSGWMRSDALPKLPARRERQAARGRG